MDEIDDLMGCFANTVIIGESNAKNALSESSLQPEETSFPSESQHHLKEEIQNLTQENTKLKKNIADMEKLAKSQSDMIQELSARNSATNTLQMIEDSEPLTSSDITRAKIVELSKKLREKAAELSHYKTKCAKLDHTVSVMRMNEASQAEKLIEEKSFQKPSDNELKVLNDRITTLTSKLFEERNQTYRLRNELKLAAKILQEEVGEGFESIQQIHGNVHWKGRAQIISDLQHKLAEQKLKLRGYEDGDNNSCEIAAKKMYLEKRIDKLVKDNESLKGNLDALTKRFECGRSRCKSLESDCQSWKMKYAQLSEQCDKERFQINTNTEKSASTQSHLSDDLKRKEKQVEKLQKDARDLRFAMKRLECDLENARKCITEKTNEIDKMKKAPLNFAESVNVENMSANQLNAERLRLLELTKVFSSRLQKERDDKANLEMQYRNERSRAAKLENQLARSRMEDLDRSSYVSLMSRTSDEGAEYKLEIANEKIKVLQTRLELERAERGSDLQEFANVLQNH